MTVKDIDFNKDYYNILGLGKDATQDDIKKAFRKMSVLWHPDKHTNDPDDKRKEAEEKFKQCNEAYSILSDESLKKAYDAGPGMGFDFETGGMDDMWEQMNPFGHHGPMPGNDVVVDVKVTLDDIKNGITNRTMKYVRETRCKTCGGSGALETKECEHCHGKGVITQKSMWGSQRFIQQTPCPYCQGVGRTVVKECPNCHGTGMQKTNEEYDLTAKPEHLLKEGTALYVGPAGSESREPGGHNGALFFRVVHDLPENMSIMETAPGCFSMVNNIKLPYWDLLLGKTVTVETPYGSKLAIKIPEQCKEGHSLRARGKGFTINGRAGDYIIIPSELKTEMKDKERELLQEIKRLHEKNNTNV